MRTFQLRTQVSSDGILKLAVPAELREIDLDVLVVIQQASGATGVSGTGWPEGFFERFAGAFAADPLERGAQGELEVREALR